MGKLHGSKSYKGYSLGGKLSLVTYPQLLKRRQKLQQYLAKGILSSPKLAQLTNEKIHTVKNDLAYFKRNSNQWLDDLALDGFTFQAQNTMEQLQDMIEELQEKRTKPDVKESIFQLIKVDLAIAHLLSLQWQISSTGPTLMNIRRAQTKYAKQLQNSN